jgi:hypothetical protein
METSLHRALKERYAAPEGGRSEVVVSGFRIDAIDPDGRLIEVQSGSLSPLRRKLVRLLSEHRVRVVKPVVLSRVVSRRLKRDGPIVSSRRSPKRGAQFDCFEDLVGIAQLFPHPNLEIEVLGVTIDEIRITRRRRPGYAVLDRRLEAIHGSSVVASADDLWTLLPNSLERRAPFTTIDLAKQLDRSTWFAQRAAYCLRMTGAAHVVGKSGNRLIYERVA